MPNFEELYAAVERRDSAFDGLFFTAVKSTRIFCRPICPARTPLAKNVEFFGSVKDALHAGYRPCKRCRPLDMGAEVPAWMAELRHAVESQPSVRLKDQDLRLRGLEPVAVRRAFIKRYGISFHAFQRATRMGLALSEIRHGSDTVEAAMNAGYESDSGFRDAFQKVIGTLPHQAASVEPAWARWLETPLGGMLAIATDEGLALLEFCDRRMLETQIKTLDKRLKRRVVTGKHAVLDQIEVELAQYFRGELCEFHTPLLVSGTPFQESVWRALLTIPYGETWSYADLAAKIGNPQAQRAVGKANGDNRLAIIIPCHRVIRSDGTLCGYGGGLWRKRHLLELENASHPGQPKLF